MKKISILLLIILMAVPYGFAQGKQKKEKQKKNLPSPIVEVWGGMGLSTVLGSLAITDKRLTGLFGAGFNMPLSQQNSLHFEGAYTFQGFKYKPQTYEHNDTVLNLDKAEQRFNYFKLTVQDRYFLDKKRTYYVNGGFYLAFLSQSKFQANYQVKIPGTEEEEHHEIDESNSDDFKPVDFGLTGGIGVRLGNKAVSCFTIEARVSYGLINIAKPRGDEKFNEKNFYGVLKLGIDIPTRN
jgi:hypothetical protein